MSNPVEKAAEIGAVSVVVGVVVGWLPTIAVLMSILWYSIKLYETKTVQRVLDRLRDRSFPID